MAKRTRKMGKGEDMSSSSDMNDDMEDDDEESSPKRRVKKVTVVETYAKGGPVRHKGKGLQQVSGFKFSGTF